jgi:hypothetical protein
MGEKSCLGIYVIIFIMEFEKMVFRLHAIQRMFQRKISMDDVHLVVKTGEIIEDYPDDLPYPSCLILGWCNHRPVHVVAAYNMQELVAIIITVYEPDISQWEPGFKRRKE